MAIDPAFLASLSRVGPHEPVVGGAGINPAKAAPGFDAMLREAANAVVTPHQNAAKAIQDFTQGADGELHKTMLSVERSDIALKYFVSVRNRCLEAYREVMRMGS